MLVIVSFYRVGIVARYYLDPTQQSYAVTPFCILCKNTYYGSKFKFRGCVTTFHQKQKVSELLILRVSTPPKKLTFRLPKQG